MYQAILTRRYLLRKVIPLLAMLSVALCTAMVIIVLSVMTGFLNMVTEAGRKLIGDVALSHQITGFPHYEEVLDEILALKVSEDDQRPLAEAASVMIQTFGLIQMPYGQPHHVQVFGIDGPSYHAVTGYGDTIYWRRLTEREKREAPHWDLRRSDGESAQPWANNLRQVLFSAGPDQEEVYAPVGLGFAGPDWLVDQNNRVALIDRIEEAGHTLHTPAGNPGIVTGIRVSLGNKRRAGGFYEVEGGWFMPSREVTLTVVPISLAGAVLPAESRILPIVNEFSVERDDVDRTYVFVPYEVLQRMLRMHPRQELSATERDEFGEPLPTGRLTPGRANRIIVKAAPGVSALTLRDRVEEVYERVQQRHPDDMPASTFVSVQTWEEQIALFINAVKKERALITVLFGIISMVAVVLVLAIFWTVVQQKTRDIGILRSLGGSRTGIAWLFLRYSAILGFVGAILGGVLAHLIVWNINPIHEFIGEAFGIVVWDPEIYYFTKVPNTVEPLLAIVVMVCGVASAVLGALIPAVRAAFIDPVSALRYE